MAQWPSDEAFMALLLGLRELFLAIVFAFVRITAALQIIPLFTAINLRGTVRATFAIVIALPLVPVLQAEIEALGPVDLLTLVMLGGKELAVGLLIGTLVSIPFWGVQAAGDLVDFSRGASAANLADPVNASEISVLGQVLLYASLAIFVVVGGIPALVDIIYQSYLVIPVTRIVPILDWDLVGALGQLMTRLVGLGILIAGPMMIAMLVIDLALVFSSRIAKQIQTMEFAAILKALAVLAMVPLYAIFLQQYVVSDWRELLSFAETLTRIERHGR